MTTAVGHRSPISRLVIDRRATGEVVDDAVNEDSATSRRSGSRSRSWLRKAAVLFAVAGLCFGAYAGYRWFGTLSGGGAPAPVELSRFIAIATGTYHSCGLTTDGQALCWGNNESGQTDAPNGTFTAIATGGAHSCGLKPDGQALCWGNNAWVQAEPPKEAFTAIATGGLHSCGLKTNGQVLCWGHNTSGQTESPNEALAAIATGGEHSCGLTTNGQGPICWGDNTSGQVKVSGAARPATGSVLSIQERGHYLQQSVHVPVVDV